MGTFRGGDYNLWEVTVEPATHAPEQGLSMCPHLGQVLEVFLD